MTRPCADYTLDLAHLPGLCDQLGVQTWPAVLDGSGPDRADTPNRADTGDRVVTDEIPDWLVEGLRVLGRPLWHMEIRTVEDGRGCVRRTAIAAGPGRVVVATFGDGTGGAAQSGGGSIGFRDAGSPADFSRDAPALLAAAVRRDFGDDAIPKFGSVTAPREHVLDILRQTTGLGSVAARDVVADGLRRLGVAGHDARVASAFAVATRRSEIVAYASVGPAPTRSPGAIGVFDTVHGRIVASAASAADGRMWTTLSPGTGHRIEQAVTLLLEPLGKVTPAHSGHLR